MHAWTFPRCVHACMHGILRCVHARVDFSTVCACMHGRLKVRACIRGPFHGVCMHAWTVKGVCMHALTFPRCVRACMDVSRFMRACVDFSTVYACTHGCLKVCACMRGLFHGVCMHAWAFKKVIHSLHGAFLELSIFPWGAPQGPGEVANSGLKGRHSRLPNLIFSGVEGGVVTACAKALPAASVADNSSLPSAKGANSVG